MRLPTIQAEHKTVCDVQRAAEILGKKEGAVYMDVQRRRIPFRKHGKRLYFFEEELYELLDQQPGLRPEEVGARNAVKMPIGGDPFAVMPTTVNGSAL